MENEKKINISLTKRIKLFTPQDRSISDIDLHDEEIMLFNMNKKHCKSQLEFKRKPSEFEENKTYVNLKQNKTYVNLKQNKESLDLIQKLNQQKCI